MTKVKDMLDVLLSKRRVSKKELETVGGLLSHCAHVIKGGKVFCRRVFDLYKKLVNQNGRYITMTDIVVADLKWWRKLIDSLNGSAKIIRSQYEFPMVSDSSMRGFGVYLVLIGPQGPCEINIILI